MADLDLVLLPQATGANGMKYARFEDLPVWQAAILLGHGVYKLTRHRFFSQPGDLRDQIRRAALSVSNNIAEGFERGTTSELIYFLYIARGSAGEVRSMLRFLEGAPEAARLKPQISDLIVGAESCSRQIRAWADNLQNSKIKGQRHLTEKSRQEYERHRDAQNFLQELDEIMHRPRFPKKTEEG